MVRPRGRHHRHPGTRHDAVISIDQLTKFYGSQAALFEVTADILHGHITGIVGPNGSGKSTLLSCIVGLEKPSEGTITVDGYPAGTDRAKKAISFTPDDLPMPDLLTGAEFLKLIGQLEGRGNRLGKALAIADIFGISSSMDKLIGGYSHGMRRRLQFAAALSSESKIIIMDEPFSGLDLEGSFLLRSAMADWRDNGGAILITMHDLGFAERECDNVIVLAEGNIMAVGQPNDLIAQSQVRDLEELVLVLSGAVDQIEHNARNLHDLILNGNAMPASRARS